MSVSRAHILSAIRRHRPVASPLPELTGDWTQYAERRSQFMAVLESVGGQAFVARDTADLARQLQDLPQYTAAQKIASFVPGVESVNFHSSAPRPPHTLADVDLAILPGELGVAENGAVWVTDREMPHRVLYFLCQHLVLVLPGSELVDHMHAAYERLSAGGARGEKGDAGGLQSAEAFREPLFGTFISGPSKTADIEQSLVIGAHGPRSLSVCMLEVC